MHINKNILRTAAALTLSLCLITNAHAGARKTIVLDAGHGGKDSGTIGRSGIYEKTVSLDVTLKTYSLLIKSGKYNVHLTRNDDRFITLADRRTKAYQTRADLFISIHCDGYKDSKVSGAHIFVLSPKGIKQALNFVMSKNKYKNWAFGTTKVSYKTAVNMMNSTHAKSKKFAQIYINKAKKYTGVRKHGIKEAAFAVLKPVSVPSVLIELGFLSNPEDERKLRSSGFRLRMAKAIIESIDEFFAK